MRLAILGALVALFLGLPTTVATSLAAPNTGVPVVATVRLADPNDPGYPFGAKALEAIHAPEAWQATTGSPAVIIAVIDSGVSASTELAANLLTGINTVGDNTDTSGNTDTSDLIGHGTGDASVAAAPINNGAGIAGICGACKILPVRIEDATPHWDSRDLAEAIRGAVARGARVINLSLRGPSSAEISAAIADACNKGIVVVVGAGNDHLNSSTANPLAYSNSCAIRVAGTAFDNPSILDQNSNYGHDWVDIAAPYWVHGDTLDGSYARLNGTSVSAPLVSGAAALIQSYRLQTGQALLAADVVKAVLTGTCTKEPGMDVGCGGVLNIYAALQDPRVGYKPPLPPPPPPPKTFKVTVVVTGKGMVSSVPLGLRCLAARLCSKTYAEKTKVLLTAKPTPGYVLKRSIGCHFVRLKCTVMVTKPLTVRVFFALARS